MTAMKQLLLRVDDALHAQLSERAQREHRSVNALANEILATAIRPASSSAHQSIRARAAALGMLAPPLVSSPSAHVGQDQRQQIIDKTRGLGAVIDDILNEDRDRT